MSSLYLQLASRFRGSLIGGLIGDCLGAPFEGDFPIPKSVLNNFMLGQLNEVAKTFQLFPYTDDTAMTKSVAKSLIETKELDAKDMAHRFTNEYFEQPKRGYGSNVIDVFVALKRSHFEHVFEPAKMQFNGAGSYGNGAAMRIAPIALFGCGKSDEELIELSKQCSLITHAHPYGYIGAVLQCLAVHQALHTKVSETDSSFDTKHFLNNLIERFFNVEKQSIEENDYLFPNNSSKTPFTDKLKKIKSVWENTAQGSDLNPQEVAMLLGNDISALESVPTAIYSVIRGQKVLPDFNSENPFVRTLYWAIAVGGDTDTIACMACSIAGALYGVDNIPKVLQKHCEDLQSMQELADKLAKMQNV